MADVFSKERRSEIMRRITGRATAPELRVRRLLHKMGLRFRLYRKDLPGCPDIVLPKHGTVVFVHGCFWHRHDCRRGRHMPKTNRPYWVRKLERNARRDAVIFESLRELNWRPLVIWECETGKPQVLVERLAREFGVAIPRRPTAAAGTAGRMVP
jgi:DNA mismatch endonuclease, patch repair protein